MADKPAIVLNEAPVILFTEFRHLNDDGSWSVIHATVRDVDDANAWTRLIDMAGVAKADGFDWANEPKPAYNRGGGGGAGGGNRQPSGNVSADIPNGAFKAFSIAKLIVNSTDKNTGQLKQYTKARFFDETHTMWADQFGADWSKDGNAKAVGILPTDWQTMKGHSGKEPIPTADCKQYPPTWEVIVHCQKGKYGYEVTHFDVKTS